MVCVYFFKDSDQPCIQSGLYAAVAEGEYLNLCFQSIQALLLNCLFIIMLLEYNELPFPTQQQRETDFALSGTVYVASGNLF